MKSSFCIAVLAAAVQVAAHAVNYRNTSAQCCGALAGVGNLAGKVVYPNSTLYYERLESYFTANAALEPWCMVLPSNSEDVSNVVRTFSEYQCPFGIRSGGHSLFKLSNSVEDGITVDLGYMNTTTYDAEGKVASIQPGARWQGVYNDLNPYGVTVPGGRADLPGVGGFVTGGGYSFYMASRGFACDSVSNFEVVLANGSVVNANQNENCDLYTALKGSSGNLGFVTRIDMNVVESTDVWGGFMFYDLSRTDDVLNAYVNLADNTSDDPNSQAILHLQNNAGEFTVKAILSRGSAVEKSASFDEFLSIENISTTVRPTNISDITRENNGNVPLGIYTTWYTSLYQNDVRILKFVDQLHKEYVAKMDAALPENATFGTLCQFQAITEGAVRAGEQNGGNTLGLGRVVDSGPAQMLLFTLQAENEAEQTELEAIGRQFVREVDEYADSLGANHEWYYLNYSDRTQDPIRSYGAESVEALLAVAAQYDPTGMFQELRRSGFKLPSSG